MGFERREERKPNGSYGGGARYHKTKMTLFSLPFFCFCATTATTPLRHSSSSSSSSVAAAAAALAVPSSCCSHFLDFRSLNFSSISGKFRFLLGPPGVSCRCFLLSSLFFSFLFVCLADFVATPEILVRLVSHLLHRGFRLLFLASTVH